MNSRPRSLRLRPLSAAVLRVISSGVFAAQFAAPAMAGGLPVPQPPAAFVSLGKADYRVTGTKGIIQQKSDRAILNWKSFNIGRGRSVEFKQPSATSIALNRIAPGARPSEILGTLKANGQVYLYNANGFLFGRDSRVDVNTLVASSLNISDSVFERGIARAVDNNLPAFTANGDLLQRDADGALLLDAAGRRQNIKIEIEQGAGLNTNAANGRILIFAPSILNAGEIRADDGQALLAAATDKVYLQQADAETSGVRGLLVEVETGGDVENLGRILTARGNSTLAGFAVRQAGKISATTSVDLNGSVVLKAAESASVTPVVDGVRLEANSTGRAMAKDDGLGTRATVTFGRDSVTEVVPDEDDATAVDEQLQAPSRIDVLSRRIALERGALIHAPAGRVQLTATAQPANPAAEVNKSTDARITLAAGSAIDVAGLDVDVPIERNSVSVQLQSNELRDAPRQKGGPLFGKTVLVDVRKGTPLADISGAAARLQRNIAERSTSGGTVKLQSAGTLTLARGGELNVSGGALHYGAGRVATTQLLGADGHVYDIGSADPSLAYLGVLGEVTQTSERFGIKRSWRMAGPSNTGVFEPAYVEGKAGGNLVLRAARSVLAGNLIGTTRNGINQRSPDQRSAGSHFELDSARFADSVENVLIGDDTRTLVDSVNATLSLVGTRLKDSGFSHARIATNGSFTLAGKTTLALADGGSLDVSAANIRQDGVIDGAGATVELRSVDGDIALGRSAHIDVTGRWINDSKTLGNEALTIAGGDVTLFAAGSLTLPRGSRIDVSAGAWLDSNGTLHDGHAGAIVLRATRPEGEAAQLVLDGELRGTALIDGGSLALTTARIELGSGAAGKPHALVLAPSFFTTGGFTDYALTADRDGLLVQAGSRFNPRASNFVLEGPFAQRDSARSLHGVASVGVLSDVERVATDLSLAVDHSAPNADTDASLTIGAGAYISTDARGAIALRSDHDIFINGTLETPGGEIDAHLIKPTSSTVFGAELQETPFRPDQGIWLGARGALLAPGIALYEPNVQGLKRGELLGGGKVSLRADRGYVLLDSTSRIDVSGASGIYDEPLPALGGVGSGFADTRLGSRGGVIDLRAAEGLVLDGVLKAAAGAGIGAGKGRLAITLTTDQRDVDVVQLPTYPVAPRVIEIKAANVTTPVFDVAEGEAIPLERNGRVELTDQRVRDGQFGVLDLRADDAIAFNGDVVLSLARRITLDAPRIQAGTRAGRSVIETSYAALGSSLIDSIAAVPSGGNAQLRIAADLIDLIGALSIADMQKLSLDSAGDIRLRGIATGGSQLRGVLQAASDVDLRAAQIYPTTFSDYVLTLQGEGVQSHRLQIGARGTPQPVLSAAGKLSFNATDIVHDGVLKAPLGRISLNAERNLELGSHSLTSVSAEDQLIPFGRTLGGLEWIYPVAGRTPIQVAPPAKHIALDGARVNLARGAQVDMSGGGDLFAYEFIAGPGGSVDVLAPSSVGNSDSYAVLPGIRSEFAPYDHAEFEGSGLAVGDSVYLSGGNGLAAGTYALLPAHYALLPGAFLVTPQHTAHGNIVVPGSSSRDAFGQTLVSGFRSIAGTTVRDTRWSEFLVEPGTLALTRSEFSLSQASTFYAAKAASAGKSVPLLPRDAGTLAVSAQQELTLRGRLTAVAAANGRQGQLDISGTELVVVPRAGSLPAADTRIEIAADELAALDVDSIFIGGLRSLDARGETLLDIGANHLEVLAGAELTAPEILLGARDSLRVATGARLRAAGTLGDSAERYRIVGDAAFVRLSAAELANTRFSGTLARDAELDVARGAFITANGSVNLVSSGDATLDGSLSLTGGALAIAASAIALGDAPLTTTGVVLNQNRLAALDVERLLLDSATTVTLHGDVQLSVDDLEIDAAGLSGVGSGQRVFSADNIVLRNTRGTLSVAGASSAGALLLDAAHIGIGRGEFTLSGFAANTLAADTAIELRGAGALLSDGDLTLVTPTLHASAGADFRLAAGDENNAHALRVRAPVSGAVTGRPIAGLGARLSLFGDDVTLATTLVLPAGRLTVTALDDVELLDGASLDLAGRELKFIDKRVYAPGGVLEMRAAQGDIRLEQGAHIDLAAAGAGRAGRLRLSAPRGNIDFASRIDAHADQAADAGHVSLDMYRINAPVLNRLLDDIADAGFEAEVSLRTRSGDIVVAAGEVLRAQTLQLIADQGALSVAGTLDARGARGGRIHLASNGGLTLASGARLLASGSAVNKRGGEVLLDSVGAGAGGSIAIEAGAVIDVTGGVARSERRSSDLGTVIDGITQPTVEINDLTYLAGDIVLRAPRTASGLELTQAGQLRGARSVFAEAVRVYSLADTATIDAARITELRNDTNSFMSGSVAIDGVELRPGVELRAATQLDLSAAWNLVDWRFDGRPGTLTLRSGGALNLNASLSDGFKAATLAIPDGNGGSFNRTLNNALQGGQSWSYRIIGGADLGSADVLAIRQDGIGDVTLARNALVRTGSGDIAVAAAGNLSLADDRAAIYTAGRQLPLDGDTARGNAYGSLTRLLERFYAEFPVEGGDIRIHTGGNILGATQSTSAYTIVPGRQITATTHQFISDWLTRTGSGLEYSGWGLALDLPTQVATATSGGVPIRNLLNARSGFRQNIGALGGGDVDIDAGGDITDLSVMLPTTGKPVGERTTPELPTSSGFKSNEILVHGGGDLNMYAGGDIRGGMVLVMDGVAAISAGGNISGGSQYRDGPVYALGDARLDVTAGGSLALGAVFDPGLVTQVYSLNPASPVSYGLNYSARTEVNLTALGGALQLVNDTDQLALEGIRYVARPQGQNFVLEEQQYLRFTDFLSLYPSRLTAAALSDDITLARSFNLLPGAQGSLNLLAASDIVTGATGNRVIINLLDADINRFPQQLLPAGGFTTADLGLLSIFDRNGLSHAATPVHSEDREASHIVALRGDIRSNDELALVLSEQSVISAGRDIENINLDLQNVARGDVTRIEAGRDIRYTTAFDIDSGALLSQNQEVLVSGPGRVEFRAGRDIDLGASNGIASVGNTRNPGLSDRGASIGLYAGFAPEADYQTFAARYLKSGSAERTLFDAMNDSQRHKLVIDKFFSELRASGVVAARNGDYRRGLAAIETLFPKGARAGEIRLYFSKVSTLAGGDIDLLAPGGLINAGLASSVLNAKPASELGIVAQGAGAVNVFSQGDVLVNASRVFALGGDDITVWSNEGNIDAGRGAKSALSVPPPVVSYDSNGNLVVTFPPVVSGSGIRTASSDPAREAGDVFLFAVKGVVNAGEAGIGGNNIVIAATAVIGAANIDVGGTAVGVPVASNDAIGASVAGASNVAASAAQMAEQASTQNLASRNQNDLAPRAAPLLITAELVGFGDYSVGAVRDGAYPGADGAP